MAYDPFDVAAGQASLQQAAPLSGPPQRSALRQWGEPAELRAHGKGKGPADEGPSAKKAKRPGTCRLFNKAPGGCPYGTSCIFVHRCTGCGVLDEHGALACPYPNRMPPGRR